MILIAGEYSSVIRAKSIVDFDGVYKRLSVESLLAWYWLRGFYRNCRCKPVYADYQMNMETYYAYTSFPAVKVDVNAMYPTALKMLVSRGLCNCDISNIELLTKAREAYSDKYVVALNNDYSEYAVYAKRGIKPCRKRDIEDYWGKWFDKEQAVELLNQLQCSGAVIPAKKLFKYVVLIGIGRTKLYDTVTWHAITGYAHELFARAVRQFRLSGGEVASVYVDTAVVFNRRDAHELIKVLHEYGYGAKVEAEDSSAVHILGVNYKISDRIGAWLLGIMDNGPTANMLDQDCAMYSKTCQFYTDKRYTANSYIDTLVVKTWHGYVAKYIDFVKLKRIRKDKAVLELKEGQIKRIALKWGDKLVKQAVRRVLTAYLGHVRSSSSSS